MTACRRPAATQPRGEGGVTTGREVRLDYRAVGGQTVFARQDKARERAADSDAGGRAGRTDSFAVELGVCLTCTRASVRQQRFSSARHRERCPRAQRWAGRHPASNKNPMEHRPCCPRGSELVSPENEAGAVPQRRVPTARFSSRGVAGNRAETGRAPSSLSQVTHPRPPCRQPRTLCQFFGILLLLQSVKGVTEVTRQI